MLFESVSSERPAMYHIELTLHSVPLPLNKALRRHYLKRHRLNKRWELLIAGVSRGKLPPEPLKKARLTITRHAYRSLDYDGLVGSLKPVVDALVSVGILSDDRWSVTGAWVVDQQFRRKAEGSLLTISVDEIP
jgi:hypothetical protein